VTRTRLIICDLDGTLVDTIADITAALNHALTAHGLPTHDVPAVRRMVGEGARQLVERGAGTTNPARVDPLLETFRERYTAFPVERTRLYDGVAATIDQLSTRMRAAVATNKPGFLSRTILDRLGVTPRFFRIYGPEDVGAHKPDPTMLTRILDEAQVAPADALFVGDSQTDAETAQRAGVPLCLVRYGYTDPAAINLLPAHHHIDHFGQLLDILS
jgi:phosphoglycolate phosphatase